MQLLMKSLCSYVGAAKGSTCNLKTLTDEAFALDAASLWFLSTPSNCLALALALAFGSALGLAFGLALGLGLRVALAALAWETFPLPPFPPFPSLPPLAPLPPPFSSLSPFPLPFPALPPDGPSCLN